mmetsp:Transcript_9348/g.34994  ORF Transcript_9348/g.34994 Transcript_9348/m.34994 type:complete len:226 (+) Transcript_9348:228-905(+)
MGAEAAGPAERQGHCRTRTQGSIAPRCKRPLLVDGRVWRHHHRAGHGEGGASRCGHGGVASERQEQVGRPCGAQRGAGDARAGDACGLHADHLPARPERRRLALLSFAGSRRGVHDVSDACGSAWESGEGVLRLRSLCARRPPRPRRRRTGLHAREGQWFGAPAAHRGGHDDAGGHGDRAETSGLESRSLGARPGIPATHARGGGPEGAEGVHRGRGGRCPQCEE